MRTTIGPFRVDRLLGEGGMGLVYAAFDPRLHRRVAVKMLRRERMDRRSRDRLWREARTAAGISHPHVCQVFDVAEDGEDLFIAMEFLEGESLASRLTRGVLTCDEAVRIALPILGALEALHQKGLVHRDLKPSNVFLTPHGVKLLDFGLTVPAAADAPLSETRLTQTGTILGTPQYMAPEQVRGEEVDARADLFSLGAMLVEMTSGRPPFRGTTAVDVLHAVLHGAPDLPDGGAVPLYTVATRALAKEPRERYPSAAAMAEALRALDIGDPLSPSHGTIPHLPPVSAPSTRLIVLPFRLLRPDPEIDFLGFSLADAITTSLTGLGSLIVRSSLTASRIAGETPDLASIARATEVDVLVTGTLLRMGSQLRVSAQLLEMPEGTVLWSQSSQVAFDDIFRLQDELAQQIVSQLELPLTAREDRRLKRDVPSSGRAYEWYLRANQLGAAPTGWREARALLERCVTVDPSYAPAWARLGRLERLLAKYSPEAEEAAVTRAEGAFRRALELNPDLSIAHTGYAALEVELGRPQDAMVRLLRLARGRPTDATLFAGLVHACRYCGLLDASVAAQVRARLIEPSLRTSVGYTYMLLGQYRRALEDSDQPLDSSRSFMLALLGEMDAALEAARQEGERAGPGTVALFTRATCHVLEGRDEAAWRDIDALRRSNFSDPEGWFHLALLMARLGDLESCEALLAQTVRHGYYIPSTLQQNAWLAPLRPRPAFQRVVADALEAHRRAVAAYAAEGGPDLLGVPARTQTGDPLEQPTLP